MARLTRVAKADKAHAVLQAARIVFLTHGFSAATTDMIQREAGVSKSTVYEHYANKEALFAAVIEAECAASMATVRSVALQSAGLHETLTALARAYIEVVMSPAGLALFRVAMAEAPRFPHLARTFYSAGPRVTRAMVAEHLARAAESGDIDISVVGLNAAADVFVSLVRGDPLIQYLAHPEATPSSASWTNSSKLLLRPFCERMAGTSTHDVVRRARCCGRRRSGLHDGADYRTTLRSTP